ncbi:CoA-binding protein [Dactylosporangium aurantiacum]|uniref:CoA-binding protein n=1 Tax=Dactylosporangium aurantiacum TaxID=35754 RepID=A0A9Q9MM98_9ACTN|nr:CoA-binding protein [Dactylosporangium aurantiacum]
MRTPRQILAEAHTIAVVGASRDPQKPAHWVPRMLQEQGWHIVPVNPHAGRLLGEHAYARLSDVPEHLDVVEVFRPAEEAEELVKEAAAIGAGAIWLQLGIASPRAQRLAEELGLDYVQDTCMGMERALADMVHGGCKPSCTVYHGLVPEPVGAPGSAEESPGAAGPSEASQPGADRPAP